jgi:WhiB family redox-sensing transcriptional regulator
MKRSEPDDWQLRARCRGLPTEVFYPPENEKGRQRRHREEHAKRICRRCAVIEQCRAYALGSRETYGVWGATSPLDRQQIFTSSVG